MLSDPHPHPFALQPQPSLHHQENAIRLNLISRFGSGIFDSAPPAVLPVPDTPSTVCADQPDYLDDLDLEQESLKKSLSRRCSGDNTPNDVLDINIPDVAMDTQDDDHLEYLFHDSPVKTSLARHPKSKPEASKVPHLAQYSKPETSITISHRHNAHSDGQCAKLSPKSVLSPHVVNPQSDISQHRDRSVHHQRSTVPTPSDNQLQIITWGNELQRLQYLMMNGAATSKDEKSLLILLNHMHEEKAFLLQSSSNNRHRNKLLKLIRELSHQTQWDKKVKLKARAILGFAMNELLQIDSNIKI